MHEQIEHSFESYKVDDLQKLGMETLRTELNNVAHLVDLVCKDSREKSLALTKLEEAMFWANAGVSRHG